MADGRAETATEVAARRFEHTREDALRRVLYDKLGDWRARGLVLDSVLLISAHADRADLELLLPFQEQRLRFSITNHELEMGGMETLRLWLDTIERELRRRYDDWRRSQRTYFSQYPDHVGIPEEVLRLQREAIASQIDAANNPAIWGTGVWGRDEITLDEFFRKDEADKKAKQLFISAAGQRAYDTLEAGKPLPIIGSQGTDYQLFKRAAYCIERPSDGARLCAVVPGVPMYDHMLGIKLMVEHDEPEFLMVANVAGGARNAVNRNFRYSRAMRAGSFNPDLYGYGP